MSECSNIFGSDVVSHHFLADITSPRLAASLRPTLSLAPCLWAQGLSRPGRPLWLPIAHLLKTLAKSKAPPAGLPGVD